MYFYTITIVGGEGESYKILVINCINVIFKKKKTLYMGCIGFEHGLLIRGFESLIFKRVFEVFDRVPN